MKNNLKWVLLVTSIMMIFSACTKNENVNDIVNSPKVTVEVTPEITQEPPSLEVKSENTIWKEILKSGDELFSGEIIFVAMEKSASGEELAKYFNSKEDYDSLMIFDFGNDLEYTTEIVIIPRDENVSLQLVSVGIEEDGNMKVEQILDSGINTPFKFRYDDYESTMPQYGIIIENSPYSGIIPIVHSGMDGSLAMDSAYSRVIGK